MARRLWAFLLLLPFCSCSRSGDVVNLQGCGATFPAPIYKRWFLEFYKEHPDVRTNYQAVGSGAGIRQFAEGLVHFGASDEALSEKKLKEVVTDLETRQGLRGVELIQVPMTAGSVAICYNLEGNPPLKLSRKAYIGMLLGDITHWDADEITATNYGVTLPHVPIVFVRRADSSGTTFVFTNHLNAIDPRWRTDHKGPGAGKSVQWPIGIGGKGNAGVAALIQQTPGAFGYLEAGYAKLTGLPTAALENRSGAHVLPTEENAIEALKEAKFNAIFQAAVPDPKGKNAYPIASYTWIVCRKKYDDPRVAQKIKELLLYCLTTGQGLSRELGYTALPLEARGQIQKAIEQISP